MNARGIASFALGPICAGLIGVVTLPLIAWFFSADDVGRMALFYLVMNLSVMLFGLGLDQAYVREYHDATDKPNLLMQAIMPGFALLFLFSILAVSIGLESLSCVIFSIKSAELGGLVLLCIFISYLSRFLLLVLRMEERGAEFSAIQVMAKLMFLIVLSVCLLFGVGASINVLVQAAAFSMSAVLFVQLYYVWPSLHGFFNKKTSFPEVRELLRYALPLAISGLAFWGVSAADRVLLKALSTYEELAVYSVSMSFSAAAVMLQSIFSTVWAPTVYRWLNQGRDMAIVGEVSRYVMVVVLLVFSLVGTFSWFIDFILPSFYRNVSFVVVACLGFPLFYTLSETTFVGVTVTKKTRLAVYVSFISLLVNVSGNCILIPKFGASGAAVSTCFSFWVFFLLRTEFSIRVWQEMKRFEMYFVTFFVMALACLTAFMGEEVGHVFNFIWFAVFVGVMIKYCSEIKIIFKWVFRDGR